MKLHRRELSEAANELDAAVDWYAGIRSIVYLVDGETLVIVAYTHHKQRPGYWKQRLDG
ncbi:hypothetical protein [Flexivirga lutea]